MRCAYDTTALIGGMAATLLAVALADSDRVHDGLSRLEISHEEMFLMNFDNQNR
jgi:hypothetical protein